MRHLRRLQQLGLSIALLATLGGTTFAADTVQQSTFDTPEAAVDALVAALRTSDAAALAAVLGPQTDALLNSGDAVADAAGIAAFVAAFDDTHDLVAAGNESLVLEVGLDRWPSPVPLVLTDERWRFDTAAGIDELAYRRIGRNELGAIDTCEGIVAAQMEYAATGHDGLPSGIYAQQLISDPGKRNGLYWPSDGDSLASPVGPFIARAAAEGYLGDDDKAAPYHGYVYRLLHSQGAAAPGGSRTYINNGVADGGFAVLAYPVKYGSSGIMTFKVNQDGAIYQKDLGVDTEAAAAAIKSFDPDSTWQKIHPDAPVTTP